MPCLGRLLGGIVRMKLSKSLLLLYAVCSARIIFTLLFLFNPHFRFIGPATIETFFYCLAADYDENLTAFCMWWMLIIALLWLVAILMSVIGIWWKKARAVFVCIFTFVSLSDFVCSVLIQDSLLMTKATLISSLVLASCVMPIWQMVQSRKRT